MPKPKTAPKKKTKVGFNGGWLSLTLEVQDEKWGTLDLEKCVGRSGKIPLPRDHYTLDEDEIMSAVVAQCTTFVRQILATQRPVDMKTAKAYTPKKERLS